jgi:selenide,water dikinase
VLVLTKPLGTGAIVTASIRAGAPLAALAQAIATMVTLNAAASSAAVAAGAHAMTDVTGFGLLGHLHHLCRESGLAARLDAEAVPYLDAARELLQDGSGVSGGSRRNGAWAAGFATFDERVPAWRRNLVVDATTSGGLLVAVAADRAGEVPGTVVGRLVEGPPGSIHVG